MMPRSKWTSGCKRIVLLVPVLLVLGCQAPMPTKNRAAADALATRPTGRDLDQEKVQMSRNLSALSDSTVRVYEYADGKFAVDERLTFADRQTLMKYLDQLDAAQLYPGILYYTAQPDIRDGAAFAAVKEFCIQHNVNLYLGQGDWSHRKPFWMEIGFVHDEVVWIVKSRP
jgi:hypothetical protein